MSKKKKKIKVALKDAKKNIHKTFIDFISLGQFANALNIIEKETQLNAGVPLDNIDSIIPYVIDWMPNIENLEIFCRFTEDLFFVINRKNLAFNLAIGLIRKFPGECLPNLLLGKFGIERRIRPVAVEFLKRAIDISPRNYDANLNFGILLSFDGDHEGALHYYEEAAKLDPLDCRAYFNLAESYRKIGDVAKYQYFIQESLRVNPRYVLALYSLAMYKLEIQGNISEFMTIKDKINKIDPTNPINPLLEYHHKQSLKEDGSEHFSKYMQMSMERGDFPLTCPP